MTSLYANLVNWIQERFAEMAALEEEEAAVRNKYKHEFNDSIKEIEKHHFALKEMLNGWILDWFFNFLTFTKLCVKKRNYHSFHTWLSQRIDSMISSMLVLFMQLLKLTAGTDAESKRKNRK
ncbi:uncharacterized protein TM35_000151720 [Trypanosoma theileri]|uniref:Uncharacterized protein n=1 Tax=Trypanosoma theileri TaxID=67003 RepID=A0A1X0NVU8_9TRYP|nr:uncharacterized protein TM35_000151720 [Trypanosoma theileri]ORC88741.1 hypothetical protein TM35_000151720 [Trypanosoma theileri]